MGKLKPTLPLGIALLFGWLTLVGLLFNVPAITDLILGWAGLLLAFALLLGVLNLFIVHFNRTFQGSGYSFVLILSMLGIWGIAIFDARNPSAGFLARYFVWVQAPLEAALASLLPFFLLFAGFQMVKRQHTGWSLLFILTAVLVLAADALLWTPWLPDCTGQSLCAGTILGDIADVIRNIIVIAGVRGLLIGVALGIILLAARMLVGMERPYNK